jgi:hypothetical protein
VSKSRRIGWLVYVACVRDGRGAERVLVVNHERKRQLGIPRCRWENNIKIGLQKVGFGGTDWIYLAQDRGRWRAILKVVKILRDP